MFKIRTSTYSDTIYPSYPNKLTKSLNELSDVGTLIAARKEVKKVIKKAKEIKS